MELEKWAVALSISAVICCVVELMVTNTRMERTIRWVLGMFMLCVLVMPLQNAVGDITRILPEIPDSPRFAEDINVQREELLRRELVTLVSKTLAESGITPAQVTVNMDIDSRSCISLITAEVTLHKKDRYRANRVKQILKDKLSIKTVTAISSD